MKVTEKQKMLWDAYLKYRTKTWPCESDDHPRDSWWWHYTYRSEPRPCDTAEAQRFVHKAYFELKTVFGAISCSFEKFKEMMGKGISDPYWSPGKFYRKNRMPGSDNNTRFRRNRNNEKHQKKRLSIKEINDREWRKKVKDPRDQGTRFYASMAKKCVKENSKLSERAKVRAMIAKGDWDNWYHPAKQACSDLWDYD